MKSSIAIPSLRNSGLLATSTSRPVSSFSRAASLALVPTGTVLLQTTMQSVAEVRGNLLDDRPEGRQIDRAVGGRAECPTARNTSRAFLAAEGRSVVKRSRPPATLRATSSASPGS